MGESHGIKRANQGYVGLSLYKAPILVIQIVGLFVFGVNLQI